MCSSSRIWMLALVLLSYSGSRSSLIEIISSLLLEEAGPRLRLKSEFFWILLLIEETLSRTSWTF